MGSRSGGTRKSGSAAGWREAIERELNAAKCVIVVWSLRSVGPSGSFVRDEASRAWERGTYLPVKIDDCRPPLGFGETQVLSHRLERQASGPALSGRRDERAGAH